MIKRGLIIGLFSLAGVVLGTSIAIPVFYAINEQYQNINSSQRDPNVLVKDQEVYLSTEENPLFPGDTRTLDVRLDMTTTKESKITLYYDSYSGKGYEYLSLAVDGEGQPMLPYTAIEKATQDNPLEFTMTVKENTLLQFHYTLSRDVPSTYEDLSFSFCMHLAVDWR